MKEVHWDSCWRLEWSEQPSVKDLGFGFFVGDSILFFFSSHRRVDTKSKTYKMFLGNVVLTGGWSRKIKDKQLTAVSVWEKN